MQILNTCSPVGSVWSRSLYFLYLLHTFAGVGSVCSRCFIHAAWVGSVWSAWSAHVCRVWSLWSARSRLYLFISWDLYDLDAKHKSVWLGSVWSVSSAHVRHVGSVWSAWSTPFSRCRICMICMICTCLSGGICVICTSCTCFAWWICMIYLDLVHNISLGEKGCRWSRSRSWSVRDVNGVNCQLPALLPSLGRFGRFRIFFGWSDRSYLSKQATKRGPTVRSGSIY